MVSPGSFPQTGNVPPNAPQVTSGRTHCWLMDNLLSIRTPRSFFTDLLFSSSAPSLYWCVGLLFNFSDTSVINVIHHEPLNHYVSTDRPAARHAFDWRGANWHLCNFFKEHSHSAGHNQFSLPLHATPSSTTAMTFMSSSVTDTPQFVWTEFISLLTSLLSSHMYCCSLQQNQLLCFLRRDFCQWGYIISMSI